MSDSENEFEPPKITSTQLSPKKVSTTEQLAFQNKLQYRKNVIDINSLLKSKSKSVAAKVQVSPIIKKKLMDDERDSSYFSSNEGFKKNSQSSSRKAVSSDSGDSQGTSSEVEEKQSESSSSSENSDASKKKKRKMTKIVKKTNLTADDKDTSSSSSEESDSNDDMTQKEEWLGQVKETLQQNKKEEMSASGSSSTASDESDSSEDDSEKKSTSEGSSESGSDQEDNEKRRTQEDSESGSESSSEDEEKPPGECNNAASESDSGSEHGDDSRLNRTNYVPTKRTARMLDDHVEMYSLDEAQLDDAFDLAKLSEDDEVFFVSVDKSIDPSLLVNSKLSLERRQRIRLQCGDCVVEFDKHDKEKLCLLGKMGAGCGVKHVHTAGGFTINVDQKIAAERATSPTAKQKTKVPFPEDKLRVRHPLFGRHYQQKIVLDERVATKLDELISGMLGEDDAAKRSANDATGVKAKKRKKHKKDDERMDVADILSAFGDDDVDKEKTKKASKRKEKKETAKSTRKSQSPQRAVAAEAKARKSSSPAKQANAAIAHMTTTPKTKQGKSASKEHAAKKATEFGTLKNEQARKLLSSTMNSPSLHKAAFFDPNESFIPPSATKKKVTTTPMKRLSNFAISDESIMKLFDEVKGSNEHSDKKKKKKKKDQSPSEGGDKKQKRKNIETEKEGKMINNEVNLKSIDEAVLHKEHSSKKDKTKKVKSQTEEKDESKSEKRKRRHSLTVAESERVEEKKKEKTSQIKKRRPTMI